MESIFPEEKCPSIEITNGPPTLLLFSTMLTNRIKQAIPTLFGQPALVLKPYSILIVAARTI
jgi:hypothetical protein